jgi:hypothetical protein
MNNYDGNILIIGIGQIGRRHMESIVDSSYSGTLHVMDPSINSINAAKKSFLGVGGQENKQINNIKWHSTMMTLPNKLDLVIVSTAADVRYSVLCEFYSKRTSQYLILEKVLFQNLEHFEDAKVLLNKFAKKVWVNCPRRTFDIYKRIKLFFLGDKIINMKVSGGNWGLGCNSIHYLDVFSYLVDSVKLSPINDGLDAGHHPSKRDRFLEFTGSLSGILGETLFTLESKKNNQDDIILSIEGLGRKVIINETKGICTFHGENNATHEERFEIPYQSHLSSIWVNQILQHGDCDLIEYKESALLHIPFIKTLLHHISTENINNDSCPIT